MTFYVSSLLYCRPCILENSVSVIYNASWEEQEAFSAVAKDDFRTFLLNRSKELAPGKYMFGSHKIMMNSTANGDDIICFVKLLTCITIMMNIYITDIICI